MHDQYTVHDTCTCVVHSRAVSSRVTPAHCAWWSCAPRLVRAAFVRCLSLQRVSWLVDIGTRHNWHEGVGGSSRRTWDAGGLVRWLDLGYVEYGGGFFLLYRYPLVRAEGEKVQKGGGQPPMHRMVYSRASTAFWQVAV